MIRDGICITFQCSLVSPFHTTQREYQNLLTCAPYVLGTTIRGAVLGYLIQKHCTREKINQLEKTTDPERILQIHESCGKGCPLSQFFEEDTPNVLFSFGEFHRPEYLSRTRIALRRDFRNASEGAIANVECIQEGSKFNFEVVLFDGLIDREEEIAEAVRFTGEYLGIGRFKSVGLGRFRIEEKRKEGIETLIERVKVPDSEIELVLRTPLVFMMRKMDCGVMAEQISNSFLQRFREISGRDSDKKIEIAELDIEMKPEFIHRHSFERSQVENRLVMDVGSKIRCVLSPPGRQHLIQLKIASRFGIGDWRNCGFGRFHVKKSKRIY
ncbi:MAG: RAMP superfamily CRISPR-associated protein [Candidatus Methanofastidiosia archaeon]